MERVSLNGSLDISLRAKESSSSLLMEMMRPSESVQVRDLQAELLPQEVVVPLSVESSYLLDLPGIGSLEENLELDPPGLAAILNRS